MNDDLFTYEVEIHQLSSIPCNKKEGDDSDYGDLDVYELRVCYDEDDGIYIKVVIFVNKRLVRLMDVTNDLWIYWTRGDDEVEHTNEEFSDPNDENLINNDEVAEIFRIETDIFDFEIPICKAFNEFNYLFKYRFTY
ncbi:hypothetical protein Tco_0719925 [Tanacetum coccineum]